MPSWSQHRFFSAGSWIWVLKLKVMSRRWRFGADRKQGVPGVLELRGCDCILTRFFKVRKIWSPEAGSIIRTSSHKEKVSQLFDHMTSDIDSIDSMARRVGYRHSCLCIGRFKRKWCPGANTGSNQSQTEKSMLLRSPLRGHYHRRSSLLLNTGRAHNMMKEIQGLHHIDLYTQLTSNTQKTPRFPTEIHNPETSTTSHQRRLQKHLFHNSKNTHTKIKKQNFWI